MNRLYITDATYVGDYTVRLTFSEGTVRDVDFGSFLRRHPHPQYNKYQDLSRFRRFHLDSGNIVWGKNWDLIFPVERLYQGHI